LPSPIDIIAKGLRADTAREEFMRRVNASEYGRIELANGPARLALCLELGLYQPISPALYSAGRVARLLALANRGRRGGRGSLAPRPLE